MRTTNKKSFFKYYQTVNNNKILIMWDYTPIVKTTTNGGVIETPLASWEEYLFDYIPSFNEIQHVILDYYNQQIENEIKSGCVWKNMNIWLSLENQINFKVIYDLTQQTNGQNLPITLKLNTSENPIYYDFNTVEDVSDFYLTTIKHIQNTLQKGWEKKDSINWSNYKI